MLAMARTSCASKVNGTTLIARRCMLCLWNSGSRLTLLAVLALGCSPGEPIESRRRSARSTFFSAIPLRVLHARLPGQLSRSHHSPVCQRPRSPSSCRRSTARCGCGSSWTASTWALVTYVYDARAQAPCANRTERFPRSRWKDAERFVSTAWDEVATVPLRYRLFVYPINRAPEHGAGTVVLNQVRSEEDLETSADIDEYALGGTDRARI